MIKHLNEDAMRSELNGSAFFSSSQPSHQQPRVSDKTPRDHDTRPNTDQDSKHETVTPRHRGPTTPSSLDDSQVVETIRRAVHQLGKEDATYRFTSEEKKALADVVYTYGAADIKTSQNEITRIGINWLMEDYRANGAASVLARVLERLNA